MPEAAIGRDEPVYRDVQRLPFWAYGVLAAIAGGMVVLATTLPRPGSLIFAAAATLTVMIGLIIAVNFSAMTTEVAPDAIRIRFGLFRFEIPLSRLLRVEVVEVNPWATDNWGVRGPRLKGGYLGLRVRGGVKVSFEDGKEMVLGKQLPRRTRGGHPIPARTVWWFGNTNVSRISTATPEGVSP